MKKMLIVAMIAGLGLGSLPSVSRANFDDNLAQNGIMSVEGAISIAMTGLSGAMAAGLCYSLYHHLNSQAPIGCVLGSIAGIVMCGSLSIAFNPFFAEGKPKDIAKGVALVTGIGGYTLLGIMRILGYLPSLKG